MYKGLAFLFCLLCITGCALSGLSVKLRKDKDKATRDAPGLKHLNDEGGDGDKEGGQGDAGDSGTTTSEAPSAGAGNTTESGKGDAEGDANNNGNGTLDAGSSAGKPPPPPPPPPPQKSHLKRIHGHGVDQFRLYLSTATPTALKKFTAVTSRRSPTRPPQEDYAESAIRLVTFFYGYRRVGLPPRFNRSVEGCKHVEGTHIYPCYASCVVKATYMYKTGEGIHAYKIGQLLTEINPIAISPEELKQRDQIVQNLLFCNMHLAAQTKAPCEEQAEFWHCVKDAFMSVLKTHGKPTTTGKPRGKIHTSRSKSTSSATSAGTVQTSPAPVRSEAEDEETTEETTTPPTTTDAGKRSIKKVKNVKNVKKP